jgi:photosystem II stability/assembly factor-like uncharacterized protein
MRRSATAAWAVALLLALPAASRADARGWTPIGPPAALNDIVIADDGSLYGTVDAQGDGHPIEAAGTYGANATLWRSTDHGQTWNAVYRAPAGVRMAVIDSSPADSASVYVSIDAPKETNRYLVERVDARMGNAVVLPAGRLQGIDAAGTAYLLSPIDSDYAEYTMIRCAATAATCESAPTMRNLGYALVDRKSVGLLVSAAPWTRLNSLEPGPLWISNDGGRTWATGATLPGGIPSMAFAGPAPRTLYALGLDGPNLVSVSHDAGLTWSPSHPVDPAGGLIIGTQPAVVLRGTDTYELISTDEGASYRKLDLPYPPTTVAIDPTDAGHLVLYGGDQTEQTVDGGRTWSEIADPRFGTVPLTYGLTAGAGHDIYSLDSRSSIWLSHDTGATWSRSPRPPQEGRRQILVSRDDPGTAYVYAQVGTTASELRTRDGGQTWQTLTMPPYTGIRAIQPGDPARLFSTRTAYDSSDAGTTWTPAPAGEMCMFAIAADPASPTGLRLGCDGWTGYDVHRALDAKHLPDADGLFGSPDRPGAFAVATGSLLGDVQSDWSWSPLLAPTDGFGPAAPDALALTAWPARGGTTFLARSSTGTLWARRGTGRWWRLQHAGSDLLLYTLLDATHAIVRETSGSGTTAVIDLAHPDIQPPQIQTQDGALTCAVPWSPVDVATSAYAWLRDGGVLRGAKGAVRALSRFDRGHDLTCRATARTAWGSTTLAAVAVRVAGARIAPPRPRLKGTARVGARLRCSGGVRVDWLRDGRLVGGTHARRYLVRVRDAGRAIACEVQLSDGTVTRSRSVQIGRS